MTRRRGAADRKGRPWRREPASAAPQLIEREAKRDRVEPRPDVDAVEPVPRSIGLEVRVLGDVLGVVRIADDEDEASDEVRVVRADGLLEGVLGILGGGSAI